jgi:hypothetical protein
MSTFVIGDIHGCYVELQALLDWAGWQYPGNSFLCSYTSEAAHRVQNLQQLREHYHKMLAGRRSAPRLLEVVDFLIGNPILTVRSLQADMGLADFKTVQRYVDALEEVGILREVTGKKRNRLHRAEEVFAAIQKPLEN